jgi:hypothetical protein
MMRPHSLRPRTVLLAGIVLIVTPVLLYKLLPHAGVPVAAATTVAIVIGLKHAGLVAALLAPLYAIFRRRRR